MPLCNDPIKIIVHHDDIDSVANALVKYGAVDEIIGHQNNSVVTFAWWFPTGIGANLRSLMQAYMVTDICIEGRMVQVQRLGNRKVIKKHIATKDPYSNPRKDCYSLLTKIKTNEKAKVNVNVAAIAKAIANAKAKAKKRSLDSLY